MAANGGVLGALTMVDQNYRDPLHFVFLSRFSTPEDSYVCLKHLLGAEHRNTETLKKPEIWGRGSELWCQMVQKKQEDKNQFQVK